MRNLFLLLIVLIAGCSPVKRIQRICERHPSVCEKDTLHIIDTLITQAVRADTVVRYKIGDTIVLRKDKLTVRTIIRKDTIYQTGECAADTVIKYRTIVRDKVIIEDKKGACFAWYERLGWGLAIFFFGLLLLGYVFRKMIGNGLV